MKIIISLLVLTFFSTSSYALPSRDLSRDVKYKSVLESLKLPRKNRLLTLRNKPQILDKLQNVALDDKLSLRMRWRAITTMGEISPLKAQPHLEKLMVKKEWFLRNAAMIAISHSDRPTVMKWAQKLLNDKSLMVRTSAVQAIKKIRGIELQDLLWEKINSKENFHRGKSLWIRKHIADALASFAYKGEEKKFMRLLLDRDQRLHPFALRGLKRSTGKSIGAGKTVKERRVAWIQHYKSRVK